MRRAILVVMVLAASGCPHRFQPSGETHIPSGGAPQARERFESARARFERAEYEGARQDMEAIRRDFPDDPVAPYAALYAGMTAHRAGDDAGAVAALAPLARDEHAPDEVRQRARFHLGLAEAALGKHAEARELLTPFAGQVAEGEDETELQAALAEAAAAAGDVPEALDHYDRFFARARPAERAYIIDRVSALAAGLPPDAARAAYDRVGKDGPAAAFLGQRLVAAERAAGNGERARAILGETAGARAAVGLPPLDQAGPGEAAGDPQLLGAVLPLSRKRRLVGEAAARGLTLAAGTYDRGAGGGVVESGVPRPFEVLLEDAGEGRERAVAALEALGAAGVIAAVGPLDRDAAEEAARRADSLGLPLVTLEVAEGAAARGPFVFHAVVPLEARARALARHALAKGARRFAILGPDIPYGTRAAAAFRKEVEAGGGTVIVDERYAKDAVAFVGPVAKIAGQAFDALFIPDTAARLELVAPQLAVNDLVVQAPGEKRPKRGRAVFLLSTAEALGPKFLRGSGRYASGAALAPGFYPDDRDARIGAYVARFRLAYGDDPTFLDAYAYDAALLVRAAVEAGAADRAALAAALAAYSAKAPLPGLTGDIWFDDAHARGDRGVLYTVVPEGGAYAIRAVR